MKMNGWMIAELLFSAQQYSDPTLHRRQLSGEGVLQGRNVTRGLVHKDLCNTKFLIDFDWATYWRGQVPNWSQHTD